MNLYNKESIKKFTGLNDETVDLLAVTFLEELELSNTEIRSQVETEDLAGIKRSIHKMKPGYIMFGFEEIIPVMKSLLDLDADASYSNAIAHMVQQYLNFSSNLESSMKASLK